MMNHATRCLKKNGDRLEMNYLISLVYIRDSLLDVQLHNVLFLATFSSYLFSNS